jgi:hypothetical protein
MNTFFFVSGLLLLFTGAWWWMLWKAFVLVAAIAVCQPHTPLGMMIVMALVFCKEILRLYRGGRRLWWRVQDRYF